MDLKAIKDLAQQYTQEQLNHFASELETTGKCGCSEKSDSGEIMSDLLQALEVRKAMDNGQSLQEAIRDFSRRVRAVLS